jgi:hypothetical protein
MKGMILERNHQWFTNMQLVFKNLNGLHKNYNWLITNSDCYPQNEDYFKLFSSWNPVWMSGENLDKMIMSEEFQWVSGVLSAFEKDVPKEEVFKYDNPIWESADFWKNPISIQHPLAEIEIVPWDGMLLLFISKYDKYAQLFQDKFPDAQDLEEYNRKLQSL